MEKSKTGEPYSEDFVKHGAMLGVTAFQEAHKTSAILSEYINNNIDNEYAVKALQLIGAMKMEETNQAFKLSAAINDSFTALQSAEVAQKNADTNLMGAKAQAARDYAGANLAGEQTLGARQDREQDAIRFPNVLAQDEATLDSTRAGTLESLEGVQDRRAFRPWQTKFYEYGAKKSGLELAQQDELWQRARQGLDRKDYEERRQEFIAAGKFIQEAQQSGFNLDAAKSMLPPNMKLEDFLGAAKGALEEHGKEVETYRQMARDEQRAIDAGKGDPSRLEKFNRRIYQLETEAREVAAQELEWKDLKDEQGQLGVLREHIQNLVDFIPGIKNWAVGSGEPDGTKVRPNPNPSVMQTPDRAVREESLDQGPPMARDPQPPAPYTPGDY